MADRSKPHCFELFAAGNEVIKACKTDSDGKVVEGAVFLYCIKYSSVATGWSIFSGKHTVYRMSASTEEEKDEWIKCIQQSISHNPFYDMLAARKKKAQKNSP